MHKMNGWKKVIYAGLVCGIVMLAAYGIGNTVSAWNDAQQAQASLDAVSADTVSPCGYSPGSPYCNPAGCAACTGCSQVRFEESISSDTVTVLPDGLIE